MMVLKVHYSRDLGSTAVCGMKNPKRWIWFTAEHSDVTCKACISDMKERNMR